MADRDKSIGQTGGVRVSPIRIGDTELVVVSAPTDPFNQPDLTDAEQDVLVRLLAGASNAQIAAARRTSIRTVGNQIATLFQKFGVTSRGELAALRSK